MPCEPVPVAAGAQFHLFESKSSAETEVTIDLKPIAIRTIDVADHVPHSIHVGIAEIDSTTQCSLINVLHRLGEAVLVRHKAGAEQSFAIVRDRDVPVSLNRHVAAGVPGLDEGTGSRFGHEDG